MFAHLLARLAVVCGLLMVANGCSHCGHCKPGLMDCLIGGRCDSGCCDSGCGDCNTGCGSCGHGCGLGSHIRHKMACAPQFGGEAYQDCGCGELYHGDWKSHPPCADPCDCYGNNTGCPKNCCENCQHLNRGRFCGLKGFFKSMCHEHGSCSGCDSCDSCGGSAGGCTTCGH